LIDITTFGEFELSNIFHRSKYLQIVHMISPRLKILAWKYKIYLNSNLTGFSGKGGHFESKGKKYFAGKDEKALD
jgi:hypothetical protein